METWEHKGEQFVVVRFTIEHYTNINVYELGVYTPFFGDKKIAAYLKANPKTKILILEESEVDTFFRNPVVIELGKYREVNGLSNEAVMLFQGTGQEGFIEGYLRRYIPTWMTLVQSHSAPYNLMHNWVKTYSEKHFSYEELEKDFKPEYSLNDLKLKKKFIVFAGKPRVPRLMVLGQLRDNDLLDSCYYNFGVEYIKRFKEFMSEDLVDKVLKLHGHEDYSKTRDKIEIDFQPPRLMMLSNEEKEYLRNIQKTLPIKDVPYEGEKDYYYTPFFIIPDPKLYKECFLDFVLETFNHRGTFKGGIYQHTNFFTEKIFKPTLTCRPFMALGNKNYLRDLRDKFDFKTFGNYWDESYDDKDDIRDALPIMTDNLKYLNNKTLPQLENMLVDMKDILVHNNIKAREYLEGDEIWKENIKDFIEGKAKSWRGQIGINFI
jgi:hypothetical protein